MSARTFRNLSASVRQRLLNRARSDLRPFNELLQYYAIERFLYRLSQSPYADKFILKGGLLMRVWRSPEIRPTMDIDMLGIINNEESDVISKIQEIVTIDVEPDGLDFDPDSIRAEKIIENADYEGVRILLNGFMGTAKVSLQIDIGFGDAVFPRSEKMDLPAILNFPIPCLQCYSRESVIAEKFEIMVKLGELNSRMKDFYDIWMLSQYYNFEGTTLVEAIRLTFERRKTSLPDTIIIFTEDFIIQKQTQWIAFLKRLKQSHAPDSLSSLTEMMHNFLSPLISSLSHGTSFPMNWIAPGPWN
ncbi:MAG: nucleotidyl transferase AbiEii/AbiGii toxin family protein [Candidatus Latescibacteria bacterium]|nr:nucleotidyl transferase AbiEii/AbiGii toxin family protein [Candidatus Latescibacterota bacterium]